MNEELELEDALTPIIYSFLDIFPLTEIQKLQDLFSKATGVASIITNPDGTPITEPSGFSCFCKEIIRSTEIGLRNCIFSDAVIGSKNNHGPHIQKCLSAGLMDGGARILVDGNHIGNWLIGQVLEEDADIESLLPYADCIGVNREYYYDELMKIKRMSIGQFEDICEFLYLNAQHLSRYALKNIRLNQQIELKRADEVTLKRLNQELEEKVELRTQELQRVNNELESKVLERTNQLVKVNKKLEKEISKKNFLIYHDFLTGLYNRIFCEEEMIRMNVTENLPISIVIADLNGLKVINDAFGHRKGDELLIKASRAIESALREQDILTRWGGDEFVVLMPRTGKKEAQEVMNKIRRLCLNEQVNAVKLSISFGWDTKTLVEQDIFNTLNHAENKMFRNKIVENEGIRSSIISTVINTLHEKNPREEQHSMRVSELSQLIGEALELEPIEISNLKMVGLLHDIGKIGIDEKILNKPGKLTDEEYAEIKRHPEVGFRILNASQDMAELAHYTLFHHERWDGLGYPNGLLSNEIPLISRIITIADSYDAMTSERTYKKELSPEEAILELARGASKQFDPVLVDMFIHKVLATTY